MTPEHKPENVSASARVYGDARVSASARVYGNAEVYGYAQVYGDARVSASARVYGNAEVYGDALVYGDARVFGNARVFGGAEVFGDARVSGNARVFGDALVSGDARVGRDAEVFEPGHVVTLTGLYAASVTLYRTATGHRIQAGCQNFTLDDDLPAIATAHGWSLPAGWEHVVSAFRAIAEGWHAK